jgi:indole-3-glycerol phosphate synthase/phosphoribosylanthranilate isomerase/anthranilate synthase/indole-3-glycerol phosphate synthase/phosphoribosylanthranilate isomerase
MGRFRDALSAPGLSAVAEIKRRSPSMGELRPDADPAQVAAAYERAGAAAVSVLVDAERFGGSWDDLRDARAAAGVPLLAKGFFSDETDIETAAAAGADALLLLLRDLDDATCARLMAAALDAGIDVFVEAHDGADLARALALGADPIGVNARDLSTFEIDRGSQLRLVTEARVAAPERVVVAESGIWNRAQGAEAELAGADAILVGSSLMKAPDPAARLADLLARPLVKVCGLTRAEDVAVAAEAGADLAGFILADSPRRAAEVLPVPDTMLSVAVFVEQAEDTAADLVQLHDVENGHRSREATLLHHGAPVARVLDLPWLGEDARHWSEAAARARKERVVLAGGLAPENVRDAIDAVQPWCVDAARSLESSPGIKDAEKVRAFVKAVRT